MTDSMPPVLDYDITADNHGVDVGRSCGIYHLCRIDPSIPNGVEANRNKIG